ncbi:M23 family metallopeptidase [Candidatus Nitrotoga sp. M5]|uniref:M23 family metallopeptidase n=1 Tax=Candidatus Nitrotoga sp. M5 TaxID=2890409 RepID=UPI001EF464C9|nr:M23 family metallopeptidase [Candidatus Nitrotoga sp. M5]CAH1387007.1 Peptidase_M23 domain-containing protein [Candidatus Nitrotoga sp. M5]
MFELIPPNRGTDKWGSGHYHASRGTHLHNGVDKLAMAGSQLKSLTDGYVTKLGFAYADDLSYRYVQVSDGQGHDLRYFYLDPKVEVDQRVYKGDILGEVQNLGRRYAGIGNHFHFEVRLNGGFIDPEQYILTLRTGRVAA